jgi:uncharacterized protein
MKIKSQTIAHAAVLAWVMLFAITQVALAEYEAMQDVESTNAVFDFRIGDPQVASAHLDLIHSMHSDPNMRVNETPPDLVIVFIGPSVRLVSTHRSEFNEEEQKTLDDLAEKISNMEQDGIRFEICMTSAPAFNIDPGTILPEVKQVENGWISAIGYQQRGHAYVANF